ncbi:MAG TPA: T9SS type A sorting domain-containing protein [Flavobacterium sp.]|jgi:photosystem II stability/assembly factor-like uncharacterized protein
MYKIAAIALFFTTVFYGQSEWSPLTSIPSNVSFTRYDDVFFINNTTGWAADGSNAKVWKTTDGGSTWVNQLNESMLGDNYYFRNIEFLDENVGFLGTLDGEFFKTINGGTTWTLVSGIAPNPVAICGLDAVGTSTIYGCGAYFSPAFIIKSVDSGITWQYINMSAYANALVEVLFIDENLGFASGKKAGTGGVILKTTDGGATWTQIYTSNINGEYVWKLQILQSNPNVMFGSVESVSPLLGKLIKSTDAGVTWVSKSVPDTDIQGVGFISETHGWMGGHNSPFLETFDAGDTWTDVGIGSNLNRIFIINENLAYASGTTIYKYTDPSLAVVDFAEQARQPLKATVNPNPVRDKLTVTIDFDESDHLILELYDNAGHLITELFKDEIVSESTKTYTFDFPYASGVYILNLHTNTGRQSMKFVK